jgi:flavin-dependent trigonelline monooxygenase, reductase component
MSKQPPENFGLRQCLSNFVTGVTIVTAIDEMGAPRGITANSFTSVSLEPPLVLFCISTHSRSYPIFASCSGFSVNILTEDQKLLAGIFAAMSDDKFKDVPWERGKTGAPKIVGSLATLDCVLHRCLEMGDHMIVVGKVEAFSTAPQRPLIYGQGNYISLSVQEAAMAHSRGHSLIVACIAEYCGRILLRRPALDSTKGWTLPSVHLNEKSAEMTQALGEVFSRLEAPTQVTFLYAVYEIPGHNDVNIVYRGSLMAPPKASEHVRLFAETEIPWNDLEPECDPVMLRRFFRERSFDQFGVYAQVGGAGRVATLGRQPTHIESYLKQLSDDVPGSN